MCIVEFNKGNVQPCVERGSATGISQIFGPDYPEISGSQLNPIRTLTLNI